MDQRVENDQAAAGELSQVQPVRRFEGGRFVAVGDPVINETRVELNVNDGQARMAMLCLPRDLKELAVGFLMGEGLLADPEALTTVDVVPGDNRVLIRGEFDAEALQTLSRRWTWGSGCGGGGTSQDLERPAFRPVRGGPCVAAETLLRMLHQFQRDLALWRLTGGVHACALASADEVIVSAEDVGRHNAFDKIIGAAALRGISLADKFVMTTGRLSAEIVSKAVSVRVPMLVSRCAVTGLGVQLARRFGLTLVGFARGKRLNVYTGYERVANADAPT